MIAERFMAHRKALLEKKTSFYEAHEGKSAKIVDWQLRRFNELWQKVAVQNPFYEYWKAKHKLPSVVRSLEEFERFPRLKKEDIQEHHDLIFKDLEDYYVVSTGGSTGQPMKFPTSKAEKDVEYANTYLGKAWSGIAPLDPIVMYWGHSHLFGTGVRGRLNHLKRKLLDWLINTKRFDAYDMNLSTMGKYCEALRGENPRAIIGYTSLLFKLCKYAEENNMDLGDKSRLRGVVLTSESVSDRDIEMVERVFGAPALLEYGMAECGVIAYSKDEARDLRIFWDSFICVNQGSGSMCLTTLYERKFPLIHYDTGDVLGGSILEQGSILKATHVDGRKQVQVSLMNKDGSQLDLSGILMIHLLKGYPGIYSVSLEQQRPGLLKVGLTSSEALDLVTIKAFFLKEISRDHPEIDADVIEVVQALPEDKTIAGKEKIA